MANRTSELKRVGAALQLAAVAGVVAIGCTACATSDQETVEAPRIWTEGTVLELEPAYSEVTAKALERRDHTIKRMKHIAGGMNAIAFSSDGVMTGAACWRADGTPVGIAGGLARPGIRLETI